VRNGRLERSATLLAALAAAVTSCGGERRDVPPREAAARADSVAAVPPGDAPDADSLSAELVVAEFAEAGADAVVPVLGAERDTAAADQQQGAELLGSAGPFAFVKTWRWVYACGAHGMTTASFLVVDLARRTQFILFDDSTRAAVAMAHHPAAMAAFLRDTTIERIAQPDSAMFTMAVPRYRGARLTLDYQFTGEACYACSDGRWSSYTRSVVLPDTILPPLLQPFAATPREVQAGFRIVPPDSAGGWSAVRLPPARRDALARLFGVTAPAGGEEFLVWSRAVGGAETVWLRGRGVEATIVGRRSDVWIVAGNRAWSWRTRTERVPTTPCGDQQVGAN
jgi:hypothetical protein